ncbi:polyprenyl synthetase family protein [Streptomyces sp. NPDC005808]|uniref:polyprenyl synthetase family protein n=1 Tax=Streptomyces sp. NPDC005808 TaxID=3364734 RepID=UPI0036A6D060
MRQYRPEFGSLAGETLEQARRQVLPTLRTQVQGLPPRQRHWAAFHFGWSDAEGNPVTGGLPGKGLRPALVYAAAQAAAGASDRLDHATEALSGRLDQVAAAVELVHNFCIVHDDVIDQDRERHGRPTVWTQFGSSAALLCGDSLLALAVECLDDIRLVGRLCEAVQELIHGEALDVEYESRRDLTTEDYLRMAELKTGALMSAACALGAAAAGGPPELVARMGRFGRCIGLAFQIVDDLLGIFGDPEVVGKPVGADLRRRKWTYPVLAALSCPDPAAQSLRALYRSTEPPSDAQVAECTRAIEQAGAGDLSRAVALTALADAEGHLESCGLDPRQTAALWALGAMVVDRAW